MPLPAPATPFQTVDVGVGVLFVLFYSAQRFNTPSTNRSSTTWGRYLMGLLPYCLTAVGTYLLLVFVGTPALVGFLGGGSALPSVEAQLSNPLLMALLTTVLMPKLPLLSAVDQWILKQLKEIAAIPYEVRRLSAVLARSAFTVSDDLQAAVGRRLRGDGFDEPDIRFSGEQAPPRDWTLLTALLVRVAEWKGDRRMGRYFVEHGEVLDTIEDRYRTLIPKARTCFELLREHRAGDETDKAREAIQRYADDFSEQVSRLREELLAFISRGILQADLTDGARTKRLMALGLAIEGESPSLTINQLTSLFGLLMALLLSASVFLTPLLQPGRAPTTTGVLLARAVLVSLVYTVAVACAVFPRQRWSFAARKPGQPRPFGFYVCAALVAVAISQSLSFAFNCALERSVRGAVDHWRLAFPWATMTFGLTLVTAALVDDRPPARWPPWLTSLLEGLCAAAVMVVLAKFTVGWVAERRAAFPELARGVPSTFVNAAVRAAVVGFFVGLLVPRWYRDASRRSEQPSPSAQADRIAVLDQRPARTCAGS